MSNKLSERRSLGRRLSGVTMPISRKRTRWGRNWPCLCGSAEKYKYCCMAEIDAITISDGNAVVRVLSEDIQKMISDHQRQQKSGGIKKDG